MTGKPLAALLFVLLLASPAGAAQCGGDFHQFIASMSREAAASGVSQNVISNAFMGVTQDQSVLAFDRRQRGTFRKTFEEYVATRVGAGRVKRGTQMLQRHAALLSRIERQFGVPKEVLVAIWGLETDFGSGDMGKLPVVRVPCNHGARLPPHRSVPARIAVRVEDPAARRPLAERDEGRLRR